MSTERATTSRPPAPRTAAGWAWCVVAGTSASALAAVVAGGVGGLVVAILAIGATLAGELRGVVRERSRGLRGDILARLEHVRAEHTDATVEASAHNSLAYVRRLLDEYRPPTPAARDALEALDAALLDLRRRLDATHTRRALWQTGSAPDLLGGLAGASDGLTVKHYGDPAALPAWVRGRRAHAAALLAGRVLDDVRLLNTARTESMVLTLTLWARAILLMLAPVLGEFTVAPVPASDASLLHLTPWLAALCWALATALVAPRIAVLIMAPTPDGRRARRLLLAVEVPLAVGLALAWPAWPVVAFAAGWTNWWQRTGPSAVIPDFSWARAWAWAAVTAAAQLAGLALATPSPAWPAALGEVALTLAVVVVIADTYGAMLPVYIGVVGRVLTGVAHRRRSDAEARRVIANVAGAMARAERAITALAGRTPPDDDAVEVLARSGARMLAAAAPRNRSSPRTLGAIFTDALDEGGYGMWSDDPRTIAAREHARRDGRILPVAVERPRFASEGIDDLTVDRRVADTLHRLLVACIVEARVHGTRRVQTVVRRDRDTIEVRIANQPNPGTARSGSGHGGREIQRLASSLPGAGEIFRGATDRAFLGGRGDGVLFGVRFVLRVGDTPPDEHRQARARM